MSNKHYLGALIAAFSLLIPPAAQAHALMAEETSLLAGFVHPLLGLDHLLAILAVGLWAAQQGGGSRLWQLPGTFLSMMMLGAVIGQTGWPLPLVEAGITSSLLVMGLILTFAIRWSIMPAMLMVGLFAVFHGSAHGAEMSQTLAVIDYNLGFMMSTCALLGLGVALGLIARGVQYEKLLRIGGFAIGLTGAWLWI